MSEEQSSAVELSDHLRDLMFVPFDVGKLRLPNRVVMAPMTRHKSPGGVPGSDVADYYRRRAEGGVGLIITEGAWVPHPEASNADDVPDFFGEAALAGWKCVADAVHTVGGRIMPQLWHVGLVRREPGPDLPDGADVRPSQVGPSGFSGGNGWQPVQERPPMTLADVDAVIDAFATAAKSAQDLGFDGIELHGAHGYIIDQFLWHRTNIRTDRFGGGHRERATFAADLVAEIRRRTGPEFPILFRMSQWKSHDYAATLADTPQELEEMFVPIAEAGVDLFDCSQRRFWQPTFEGSELNLAGWLKKLTGKPTMTVGSIGLDVDFMTSLFVRGTRPQIVDLGGLLRMLQRGEFDLVAVGRALIKNPNWSELIRQNRMSEIAVFTARDLKTLI